MQASSCPPLCYTWGGAGPREPPPGFTAASTAAPAPLSPDAISATNPRVIDDSRARKLSNDLKRCTYYETCATYGLNVERVFQDGRREGDLWGGGEGPPARGPFTQPHPSLSPPPVAQKVVALRKKQQLSIGPCKSLPNSPSHSSVSAASVPTVHINQVGLSGGGLALA